MSKIGKQHLVLGENTWLSLTRNIFLVIFSYPFWLAASIISTIVHAALEPSLAWIGKTFVEQLQNDSDTLGSSLMEYALVFGGLIFGLGVTKFGNQIINKIYESRLIISLQRAYLELRGKERGREDVSRILYDCEQAKKGLDILYKDSWKIVSQTVSVVVWQLTLAPNWLPALFLTVIPPLFLVFTFGRLIQGASKEILGLQGKIANSTDRKKILELFSHQEDFFRHSVRLEFFKSGAEVLMELLTWIGLLFLVMLALVFDIGILPRNIQAGDLALFAVNLNLLAKPLGEIVKVYNKGRESYPAVVRVLQPSDFSSSNAQI
ncbi:ABC transporter ATP-binding protein [Nodularia chucula]|uniref:ABC transporter ATP-binding protein n=1 Tax=Nodularia chucula TaxID=3093667 RepID=UPI0039C6481B